jgi:hypothetical protein
MYVGRTALELGATPQLHTFKSRALETLAAVNVFLKATILYPGGV